MHNNTPIVPYISLCSGYEGIGLGLHSCIPNLRCIAYCEREAYAIANLVAKMEKGLLDAAPVFTDVTTFPWEQFAPYMAGGILSFGWPCQPVSMAGKRKATEDERWLFDIIADGISILKPGMLFAENVEGLLSAKMPDGSLVFSHCIERLERLHYKVEAGIFSASEVGAPHQRKRVFILAYRQEQGLEGLRRLESDFIWNDASSHGATRGAELGNSNNDSDTEAGYAEAHRLSGERGEEVCSGFVGGADATSWPSRPGEQQYAWEPPRVIGAIPEKLANFCTGNSQSRGDTAQASGESLGERGEGADAMPHGGSSLCGGDQGNEQTTLADTNNAGWEAGRDHSISMQRRKPHKLASCRGDQEPTGLEDSNGSRGEEPEYHQANLPTEPSGCCAETMGNAASERSHRGAQDRLGLQPEVFGEGHENMGDASQLFSDGSDNNSRISERSQSVSKFGNSSWKTNDNERSKIECEMGRDAYESSIGMDISELSGISHSELAEIREWMVKTDNRTDELRLLGNGVVPPTATRAFLNLFEKLK